MAQQETAVPEETAVPADSSGTSAAGSQGDVAAQIEALAGRLPAEYADPRDEARVHQAVSALRTAHMAASLLHETRRNRRDLRAAHEAEDRVGGHYARERKANPGLYSEPDHDHYERAQGAGA